MSGHFEKNIFKALYALSFAFQLGFIIAIPIALFIFVGFALDKSWATPPLFLIVGTATGLIVTAYEVYRLLGPFIAKEL